MNLPLPTPRRSWPGVLLNIAVALVVLAVAAGMFVLSYSGVRALALDAGVSARLSRFYPGLFDALLVIACVAAMVLRDGRWWARYWAWLVIIVVLGAIGATDVAHAVNYSLPHRGTEAAVAAAPLVAVLLAFTLLLTMLRHSRGPAAKPPATVPMQALPPGSADAATRPVPQLALPVPLPATATAPLQTAPLQTAPEAAEQAAAEPAQQTAPEPVQQTPAPAEPSQDDAPTGPADQLPTVPVPTENADLAPAPTRADPVIGDYWDSDGTGSDGVRFADSGTEKAKPADKPAASAGESPSPFATAPFATIPRLKRVRATPTPPGDEDEA
jgi:hypothetical protein